MAALPGTPGEQIIPPGYAPGEVDRWAHNRRPHEREPIPEKGDRVLFRDHDFGAAVPAIVADVQDITGTPHNHWNRHGNAEHLLGPGQPDVNVWEPEITAGGLITGRWVLKPDPWPWVQVQLIRVDENGGETPGELRWCREARVRGSAGWMREGSRAHTGNYRGE